MLFLENIVVVNQSWYGTFKGCRTCRFVNQPFVIWCHKTAVFWIFIEGLVFFFWMINYARLLHLSPGWKIKVWQWVWYRIRYNSNALSPPYILTFGGSLQWIFFLIPSQKKKKLVFFTSRWLAPLKIHVWQVLTCVLFVVFLPLCCYTLNVVGMFPRLSSLGVQTLTTQR